MQRVFPIVDRKPTIDSSSTEGLKLASAGTYASDGSTRSVTGEIELQQVVFAYPARPTVTIFKNFNLKIPAGKIHGGVRQCVVRCGWH